MIRVATNADPIVDQLRSEHGSSLRAVATYDRDHYELQYARQDVRTGYSTEEMDEIYDDIVLQDIEHPVHEDLFDDMGAIRGKFRVFADGTVAHFWPTEADEGVFIALDGDADPGVRELLGTVREFYA